MQYTLAIILNEYSLEDKDEEVGTCIMMYCRPENVATRRLLIYSHV
jgi:hypothetical protein